MMVAQTLDDNDSPKTRVVTAHQTSLGDEDSAAARAARLDALVVQ